MAVNQVKTQEEILIGAENTSVNSDSLYDAFHKIQNNFTNLFSTSSQYNNFIGGDGINVTTNSSTGRVDITNTGVTSITAGTGVTLDASTGDITISASSTGPTGVSSVGLSSSTLTVTGSTIVSEGSFTVELPQIESGVDFMAGDYTIPSLTVDEYGRIIKIASNPSTGSVTSVSVEGIGNGILVTGGTVTSSGTIRVRNTGVTRLKPGAGITLTSQTGDITISSTNSNQGTVTSVDITSSSLVVTGGPINTNGSINIELPDDFTIPGDISIDDLTATGNGTFGGNVSASGNVSSNRLVSSVATGTAPLVVASTTKVTNLNADYVDGYTTSSTATANTIAVRDASAYITASVFKATGGVMLLDESVPNNYVVISAPSALTGNHVITLPASNPSTGQTLISTDTEGTLSFDWPRLGGTAPTSATSTGTAGEIRYDSGYVYVCVATNTWKRAQLATWP